MDNVFTFDQARRTTPRLIKVCDNIERHAVSYWKQYEKDFGQFVFMIKPKTDKLDLLAITNLQQTDVALKAVVLYATWQVNNK